MKKKTISPNPQPPVERIGTGQLPTDLAELNEESIDCQVQASKKTQSRALMPFERSVLDQFVTKDRPYERQPSRNFSPKVSGWIRM
jgi:bacteriocin leader peptide (microcyclamide/patellamide family)